MQLSNFDQSNDIVTTFLDVPNQLISISTSGGASNSGVWIMVLNSTSAGLVAKPETRGTVSNVAISSAFRTISNYFYGTSTYIIDANNGTTQNSTVRAIQFSRPFVGEGLYKNSITAQIDSNNSTLTLTAVDVVDNNSAGSALGLTGKMVDMYNQNSVWGTVFYDYGTIVFSNSQGTTGAVFSAAGVSGFEIGSAIAGKIRITNLQYKTRNILKRGIYFCRALNKQFNYTFNPTARRLDGKILDSLSSNPATYITSIGLYNDDGELLAVAKVSPPKKKSFNSESVFKVQLDFVWLLMFIPFMKIFLDLMS